MKITVAICTWNRARLLDLTLSEMRQLRIPDGIEWELLVVNNNCTDDTDEVIARHARHLPLQRLLERKQGHSHARNCAVDAASGELLIWTDDDVLVDPLWLSEYVQVARAHPGAVYFGGTVDPWFETDPPKWIGRHMRELAGPYVICQHGPVVRPLGLSDWVVSASMAFRTEVLRQFRFDPRLGRVQDQLVGGDDCAMLERVKSSGYRGFWVGTARVRHFIPSERLTAAFLWRWYLGAGHTAVRQGRIAAVTPHISGAPRWAVRQYVQERLKSWFLAPFGGQRWFRSYLQAARMRGVIEACRAESRREL